MIKGEIKYIEYILKSTVSNGISIYDERVEDDSLSYINDILKYDKGGDVYVNNFIPYHLGMRDYI